MQLRGDGLQAKIQELAATRKPAVTRKLLLRVSSLLRGVLGPSGVAALRPRSATCDGIVCHHLFGALLLAVEPSL